MTGSPQERARVAAQAAVESLGVARRELEARRGQPLAPGDLCQFPGTEVEGVEWVLLVSDRERRRLFGVPVDTCPLAGSEDLALADLVEEAEVGMPWVLRFGQGLWIEPVLLDEAQRTGCLEKVALEMARRRFRTGEKAAPSSVEELPAYRDWLAEGPERARGLLEVRSALRSSEEKPRPFTSRPAWPLAVAAVFLAAIVGLGIHVRHLEQRIESLSAPILDLPYGEIQFTPHVRGPWPLSRPETASHVQVGMVLVEPPEFDEYRIDLVDLEGRLVYRSPALRPRGEYSVTLPVYLLEESVYFQLYGLRDGEAEKLDQEEVRFE